MHIRQVHVVPGMAEGEAGVVATHLAEDGSVEAAAADEIHNLDANAGECCSVVGPPNSRHDVQD